MVVTRGIEHAHIKFAVSSLKDDGLFWNGEESYEKLSNKWKKYWEEKNVQAKDILFMKQVHGNAFRFIDEGTSLEAVLQNDVDALITKTKNTFLAVKTADCQPILVFDPTKNIIAAVHSGWRGTKAMIIQKIIAEFLHRGSDIKNLHVIFGPAIGACCYEVTKAPDDRIQFFTKYFKDAIRKVGDHTFIDLHKANKELVKKAGVEDKNCVDLNDCTSCGVISYPSHYKRRDKERSISMIGIV